MSTTMKRNSRLDLSKSDLLKVVAVLEGELQAREIVIAVLKSEQIKRLLNPNCCSLVSSCFRHTNIVPEPSTLKGAVLQPDQTIKPSIVDPIQALARDSFAIYEPSVFDHATTLALHNFKMFHLERLINGQRAVREHLIGQLRSIETKFEQLLFEAENQRECRQRLTEICSKFERAEKTIDSLNEKLKTTEDREKTMVIGLLKERRELILQMMKLNEENDELKQGLTTSKGKIAEMVDGLEDESKRSLQMEAELEKYVAEFKSERGRFRDQQQAWQQRSAEMTAEIDTLKATIRQLTDEKSTDLDIGEGVRSSIVAANAKVHQSVSSVSTVSHLVACVAQPIVNKAILTTTTKALNTHDTKPLETNETSKLSTTILPPPNMPPPPQPKQKIPIDPKQRKSNDLMVNDTESAGQKVDNNSVKQNIAFYEQSMSQQQSQTKQPIVRKSSVGSRIPPPVPPNKPTITKPIPPASLLSSNAARQPMIVKTNPRPEV